MPTIPLMALTLVICVGQSSPADDEGWTPLFDGKTLDGWRVNGGHARYDVEDGTIVGTTRTRRSGKEPGSSTARSARSPARRKGRGGGSATRADGASDSPR